MMNANYGLFKQSNLGSHTYQPNDKSSIQGDIHLHFFVFCGRVVAKAIFDGELVDCHFTRSFYKQILGVPVSWRDLEAVDQDIYKGLLWILQNDITHVGLFVVVPMTHRCRLISRFPRSKARLAQLKLWISRSSSGL
jgi:E3 ubiquitin-protein ligase HUWE1